MVALLSLNMGYTVFEIADIPDARPSNLEFKDDLQCSQLCLGQVLSTGKTYGKLQRCQTLQMKSKAGNLI